LRAPLIALAAVAAVGLANAQADPPTPPARGAAQKFLRADIVTGTGDLRAAVKRFRKLLGPNRREINWDAVPDEFASPNALPPNFFNARGAELKTPGDHVAVSADSSNPAGAAVRFGDINPTYTNRFKTFSPERLFSPVGSNIVNLTFRLPGTNTRAVVKGFGAVYTDIDKRKNTAFSYFTAKGRLLGRFAAPVSQGGRSFLGVVYRRHRVARVRIQYGSGKLGPNESKKYDVAVMDDFIYGEPRPAGQ
jgi:hypothetical protein